MEDMDFAKKLRCLRISHGETVKGLAGILSDMRPDTETSRTKVWRWESGTSFPQFHHLKAIAEHYNVSADYLLGTGGSKRSGQTAQMQLEDILAAIPGLSEQETWAVMQACMDSKLQYAEEEE